MVIKRIPEVGMYNLISGASEITLNFEMPVYSVDVKLSQNYPNPFNSTTTIFVNSTIGTNLKIEIFNILGQKVKTLFSGISDRIITSLSWNALDDSGAKVSSGIYLYKLVANDRVVAKKMIYIK